MSMTRRAALFSFFPVRRLCGKPIRAMDAAIERLCLGRMQNPVRGFLHGTAAVLSAIGATCLWDHGRGDVGMQIALAGVRRRAWSRSTR